MKMHKPPVKPVRMVNESRTIQIDDWGCINIKELVERGIHELNVDRVWDDIEVTYQQSYTEPLVEFQKRLKEWERKQKAYQDWYQENKEEIEKKPLRDKERYKKGLNTKLANLEKNVRQLKEQISKADNKKEE